MMVNTRKIATNMKLDAFLKEYYKNYTISIREMKLLILDMCLKLHPFENLIYEEESEFYISPRGIDFVQEVIISSFFDSLLKDEKWTKKMRNKNIYRRNMEWTNRWIQKVSNGENDLESFIQKETISSKEFYQKYNISSKVFKNIKMLNPEIQDMIFKKGGTYYVKEETIIELLCVYFPESILKDLSFWFHTKIKKLEDIYMDITFKKYPEFEREKKKRKINRVKPSKNKKEIVKKPQLIPVKSNYIHIMGIAELEMIKEELQDWHPHEKMIYKVWDTEKEIAGETYFTLHGANWYAQVYLPIQNQKSNVFFHRNEEKYKYEKMFMERMLQKENVDPNSRMDEMPSTMRHLYQFRDIEHMQNVFKMLGIEKEIYALKKEDYQILEKEYPEMQIRRYSYLYSQTKGYQESIVQYVNPVKVPKRNVEWLEIETSEPGWYYGRIINRHYFYGKGKKEVLTLNVQLDNGKKIKVRYPQVINRKTAISLMFEAGVPIRFEIEKIKINGEDHKRLKQIILMKQIGFILDWRECEMQYVPIPEIGRKPKIK